MKEQKYNAETLPIGFGMGLAMDMDAMNTFSNLSDSQKENVIKRAQNAASKDEMQEIITELHHERFS